MWPFTNHGESYVTRRFGKRLFAGAVLVSMIASAAQPLPSHERTASADCHQSAIPVAAVSSTESEAPECDHGAGTGCAAMLGCVVLPSALTSVATRFNALGATTIVTPLANGALHGRLGIGPPTPPPNS